MDPNDRFKLEIPLNSVFIFGGSAFGVKRRMIMCVEDVIGCLCKDCFFKNRTYCDVFDCCADSRKDGKEVRFVEIQEVIS